MECAKCKYSFVRESGITKLRYCRYFPPITGEFPVVTDDWFCSKFDEVIYESVVVEPVVTEPAVAETKPSRRRRSK